ncbi:hypothetical protein INR49_007725 [Caranx melampygus]|nr:hypothetical protein INR49_007725 [Caranx melampygus]
MEREEMKDKCCRQPTSSELSLSTSCPAEKEGEREEVASARPFSLASVSLSGRACASRSSCSLCRISSLDNCPHCTSTCMHIDIAGSPEVGFFRHLHSLFDLETGRPLPLLRLLLTSPHSTQGHHTL